MRTTKKLCKTIFEKKKVRIRMKNSWLDERWLVNTWKAAAHVKPCTSWSERYTVKAPSPKMPKSNWKLWQINIEKSLTLAKKCFLIHFGSEIVSFLSRKTNYLSHEKLYHVKSTCQHPTIKAVIAPAWMRCISSAVNAPISGAAVVVIVSFSTGEFPLVSGTGA